MCTTNSGQKYSPLESGSAPKAVIDEWFPRL
jgi:hypothetical protein